MLSQIWMRVRRKTFLIWQGFMMCCHGIRMVCFLLLCFFFLIEEHGYCKKFFYANTSSHKGDEKLQVKCIEAQILYVDTAKPDCPLYTVICIFTIFSFINCSLQSFLLPQPLNVSWVFKLFFLPNSILKALNLPPSCSHNQLILLNNLHSVQTRFSKAYLYVRPIAALKDIS